ncbi:hypothetical protein HD842_003176 [Massilia aurea]|uniref:Peptidase M28 domain-containing protein n=2 Tax=Massilia aurea TaxID=373040 RepID=A0A7W9X249_9BURK|nr:hypothetical protein [Massilia aurea]
MRHFFRSHWKVILAMLLAIVLATLTVETRSDATPLAARLQAHARALVPDAPSSPMQYVDTSLRRYGYVLHRQRIDSDSDSINHAAHSIEATLASVTPGAMPERTFVIGARVGPGGDVGAAAVLELARAVKDLRPAPGTEIRFVFFMEAGESGAEDTGAGNFIAFIGTPDGAQRVRQAFAALRSDPQLMHHGLATSAHVMGLTLSRSDNSDDDGDGSPATTTLLITGSDFLGYPYFYTAPLNADETDEAQQPGEFDGLARVVAGLTRTLSAMAGVVQA